MQSETLYRGRDIFEAYYRLQQICDDNKDLKELCESMQRTLPISFRICSAASRIEETEAAIAPALSILKKFCPRQVAGVLVKAPTYFAWCRAWQLGCDDRVLRTEARVGDPNSDLSQFFRWLASAHFAGAVSRQEVADI
jgi:hypothetical protein